MNATIKANLAVIASKAELLKLKADNGQLWADDLQRGLKEIISSAQESLQASRKFEGGDR